MSKIVTFEQAKKLKELGFDEETHKEYRTPVVRVFESGKAKYIERDPDVYDTGRHASFYGDVSYENYISAPTVCDALDWIREEKDIACSVHLMMKLDDDSNKLIADNYSWEFWTKDDGINIDFVRYTHPLASSALLDAVLTYLEQKEKK